MTTTAQLETVPMPEPTGPGWTAFTVEGTMWQLWAPNQRRRRWTAAWTLGVGACDTRDADDAATAAARAFRSHPDRDAAKAAAAALTRAARPVTDTRSSTRAHEQTDVTSNPPT